MIVTPLTSLLYRFDREYRFETTADYSVQVLELAGRTKHTRSYSDLALGAVGEGSYEVWLTLTADGTLTVKRGYAWDGCSPAYKLHGKWIGTPTPEATRAACLIHDALYQFISEGLWSRAEADAIFLALMRQGGFRLAPIYFAAVRIFGGIHLLFR